MAFGVNIRGFRGEQPARADELLSENHALVARDCKLASGNLVPMRKLKEVASSTAPVGTLFALDGPSGLEWLAWPSSEVDVVPHPSGATPDQRFYYSGDGPPKVSTYALANPQPGASVGKPMVSYELGLPLPETTVSPELAQIGHVAVTHVSVSSNVATYTTSQPHGLRDGDSVVVTGVPDKLGTYLLNAGVATVTIPEHGLSAGASVHLVSEIGPAPSGEFSVVSVIDPSTFTVNMPGSQNGAGNIRISLTPLNVEHAEVSVVSPTEFTAVVSLGDMASGVLAMTGAYVNADKDVVAIERSSDTVVYYTAAPHGLRTGSYVSVSGLSAMDGSIVVSGTTGTVTMSGHGLQVGAKIPLVVTSGTVPSQYYTVESVADADTFAITVKSGVSGGSVELPLESLMAVNARVTKLSDTSFSVFLPGFQIRQSGSSVSGAKAYLSGQATLYNYVYTWITPWGEESIASEPSIDVHVKYTERVKISGLPTAPPPGDNFIRGVRLYRSVGTAGYLKLADLWFPVQSRSVSRTAGVARIEMPFEHKMLVGDRLKFGGALASQLGGSEFVVKSVVDEVTFEVEAPGVDFSASAVTGFIFRDVAENKSLPPHYWAPGAYDFFDDFLLESMTEPLNTSSFDPPPSGLRGLTVAMNGMLAGFTGNRVRFSYPNEPHAWPAEGVISVGSEVVAISQFGSSVFVATESHPYVISGSTPGNLSVVRLDAVLPCVSRRSLVVSDMSVSYMSDRGVASFSQTSGLRVTTDKVHDADTWGVVLAGSGDFVAFAYEGRYTASCEDFGFVFTSEPGGVGDWVEHSQFFRAAWADPKTARQFVAAGNSIYQWDASDGEPLTAIWRSGWLDTKRPVNLGAMVVDATFAHPVHVELHTRGRSTFMAAVKDYRLIRLPSGFKSDSYSLLVRSKGVIRGIKLADTPKSLRGL